MTAVLLAAERWVPEADPRAVLDPPEPPVVPLTAVAHVGSGAGVGAVFALLPRRGPAAGVATALAVYLASHQGWVPVLRALAAGSRDRTDRQVVLVAAHVVHGLALDAALSRSRGPRRR